MRITHTLGILLLLGSSAAFGQATNSADVTGTVTDSSGAVIPDTLVTVTDRDKGTVHVVTTNQSGLYDTGPIVPEDHYTIVFSKEGFATLQRGPMTLRVGVTGMNVQLVASDETHSLVIDESAPLLETMTPEISATLPSESLQVLPQTGTPDWQSFVALMPGTSSTTQNGNSTSSNSSIGTVSANGSMQSSTALLDGASTNSPMSNNVINTPIFDTIGEVKISASLFSAQYGTGGILYNQISKGGTNAFHGLAYDYLRNTALNAANYAFGTGRVPPIHWNDFGFQIGGPVIKSKVFFFFDWDHTINHGGASVNFITVPTPHMLSGDFTDMAVIYDPITQTMDPATGIVTRRSFAEEYGNGNRIPAAAIDPVAKEIQALYPIANLPGMVENGVTTNNYQYVLPTTSWLQKWFGRFDANLAKSHRVSGSSAYNYSYTNSLSPVCPVACADTDIMNTNNQISDVWTVSQATINEARFGFSGEYDLLNPLTLNQGWPAKLGLAFAKQDIFPTINITGWYGLAPGTHANYKQNLFDLSDVLMLVRGNHVLHLGGDVMMARADSTAWGNINAATLSFTGVYTAGSNIGDLASGTGSPYADFLLGYSHDWAASFSPEYGGRYKTPAAFIQDDWKVTPNLNLNLGLRWEGRTGWSDSRGNARTFDPTLTNPATNTPGAMWYALTSTNGRSTLQHSQMNVWLPRLGLAYQVGTRMTVRGGFGTYTSPWDTDTYAASGLGGALSSSGNETDSTGSVSPVVILSSDGNTNYQGAKGASINSLYVVAPQKPESYNGQSVSFAQYQSRVPLLYSWNLTVQQLIAGDLLAELAYVGSHGANLAFITDINQVPESKLGPNDATYRPYPQYQSITGVNTEGMSNYHAMQAGISHRMSKGIMFNGNYTWSHMLSNQDGSKQGNAYQRAYDPSANYGASNFDTRHMLKAQVIYDLPFGRSRKFLNGSAVLDQIVGGWTISGTWSSQGGNPLTPHMLVNNSYSLSSNNIWFPNVVGNPRISHPTTKQWFNVNAYEAPAAGTFGNMKRNSVYGPGRNVLNMSLRKTFKMSEPFSFDFSVNATNFLNHPSFSQPDPLIGAGHTAAITGVTVGGRNLQLIGKLRF